LDNKSKSFWNIIKKYIGKNENTEQTPLILNSNNTIIRRSQWPCSLRRMSTAARLLRSWVQIPPRAWQFVCCQVEVSATDWSFVQRSPTDCGALLYVIMRPRKWGG